MLTDWPAKLGSEVLSVVIRPTNQLKITFVETDHKFKAFRMKGIHSDLEVLLDRMFKGTVATGSVIWNPTQGLINNEDIEAPQADMGDGVGSTNDNLEDNAGEDIAQPSPNENHKRATHRQAGGKKGKKLTGPAKLASQIDRLCSAIESRSSVSSLPREFDPYREIM